MRTWVTSVKRVLLGSLLLTGCGDDATGDTQVETEGTTGTGSTGTPSTDPTVDPATDAATATETRGPTTDASSTGSSTSADTETTSGDTDVNTTGGPTTEDTEAGTTGDTDTTGGMGICGNAMLEPGEVCDDGNVQDGDACSSDCQSLADCVVPQTHADIQDAVDDPVCDTVWVQPGTYQENLQIQRDVVVRPASEGEVTIDGDGQGSTVRVFVDDTVTLIGLSITGGQAEQGGGIANAGNLTLEQCTVTGNTATGASPRGGGIFSIAPLTLAETVVQGNVLTGGEAGGTVFGAGIYVSGSDVQIGAGSRIEDNEIDVSGVPDVLAGGGGLFIRNGTASLSGVEVVNNRVLVDALAGGLDGYGGAGGGIYVRSATLQVTADVTLDSNLVEVTGTNAATIFAYGGGLSSLESTVDLTGMTIIDNTARLLTPSGLAAGGGMHLSDTTSTGAHLSGLSVTGNGAISAGNVSGNAVLARGGGIYVNRISAGIGPLALSQSTIADNTVATQNVTDGTAEGGGLFAIVFQNADLSLRLESSTLAGNLADAQVRASGAGLWAFTEGDGSDASIELLNTTISNNAATADDTARGGGMFLGAGFGSASLSAWVRNVTVTGNGVMAVDPLASGLWITQAGSAETTLHIGGVLVYGNGSQDCASNGSPVFDELAPSLWGDPSACVGLDVSDAIVGQDPMLGSLGDAGGPTPTHVPADGSPALEALPEAQCLDLANQPLVLDQRGQPRPAGTDCDLGAVERQPGDP